MKDDGGPVVPSYENPFQIDIKAPDVKPIGGMSLRDYFAGQFLMTIRENGPTHAAYISAMCYSMADAMLAERAK